MKKGFTRQEVEDYIENYTSDIGDSGEDLFKESDDYCTKYSWDANLQGEIDNPDFVVSEDWVYSPSTDTLINLIDLTDEGLKRLMEDDLFNC